MALFLVLILLASSQVRADSWMRLRELSPSTLDRDGCKVPHESPEAYITLQGREAALQTLQSGWTIRPSDMVTRGTKVNQSLLERRFGCLSCVKILNQGNRTEAPDASTFNETIRAYDPSITNVMLEGSWHYLLAFMVTNTHQCHIPDHGVLHDRWSTPFARNRIGVAVVRPRDFHSDNFEVDVMPLKLPCGLQTPRLIRTLDQSIFMSSVVPSFRKCVINGVDVRAGHTVLSRLTLSSNGTVSVEATGVIRVLMPEPFASQWQKNMNILETQNGNLLLEYRIHPHLLCLLAGARNATLPREIECVPYSRSFSETLEGWTKRDGAFSIAPHIGPAEPMLSGSIGFLDVQVAGEGHFKLGLGHIRRVVDNTGPSVRLLYTHFFYLVATMPPFSVRYASPEFCFPEHGVQKVSRCVSAAGLVQTANGMILLNQSIVLVTYGEHDCSSNIALMSLPSIIQQMVPLDTTRAKYSTQE